jgi:hypothetical protein
VFLVGAAGCAKTPEAAPVDEEPAVRARFEELQEALKGSDPERVNQLLTIESQADAQGVARFVRAKFAQADDETRKRYRADLDITPDEMMRFNGPLFFKTRPFRERYKEIRDGKFERASIQGDNAKLYYRDDEGEQEKLILIRENGEWRFWLKMPSLHLEEGKDKDRKAKP